jgi:hypothetical protein
MWHVFFASVLPMLPPTQRGERRSSTSKYLFIRATWSICSVFFQYLMLCCCAWIVITRGTLVDMWGTGKVVSVLNKLSISIWKLMEERPFNSTILDLGTRWRWVVSFTPRPLYPGGKSPLYPFYRYLDVVEKRKMSCPCRESNRAVHPEAHRYTDWAIPSGYVR